MHNFTTPPAAQYHSQVVSQVSSLKESVAGPLFSSYYCTQGPDLSYLWSLITQICQIMRHFPKLISGVNKRYGKKNRRKEMRNIKKWRYIGKSIENMKWDSKLIHNPWREAVDEISIIHSSDSINISVKNHTSHLQGQPLKLSQGSFALPLKAFHTLKSHQCSCHPAPLIKTHVGNPDER